MVAWVVVMHCNFLFRSVVGFCLLLTRGWGLVVVSVFKPPSGSGEGVI